MARAVWLAAVLRNAGLHVVELDGWQTRETRAGFEPEAIIWHHTATPRSASDLAVRRLLRDGRAGLPGPLSQLGLERDGTYAVIAAGRCNHNGFGTYGNDSIGIEAYNDGVGEPWPKVQLEAYDRGTAAICRALGVPASRVLGHRESDPGRKVDPTGVDMDAARNRVAQLLSTQPQPTPIAPPEDVMLITRQDQAQPADCLLLANGKLFKAHKGAARGNDATPEVAVTADIWADIIKAFGPVID